MSPIVDLDRAPGARWLPSASRAPAARLARVRRLPAVLDVHDVWIAARTVRGSSHRAALGARWLARGASLAVWPGEVVLLAGMPGVRRAALFACIDGALSPSRGVVRRGGALRVEAGLGRTDVAAMTVGDALIESVSDGSGVLAPFDAATTCAGVRRVAAVRRTITRHVPCRVVWFVAGRTYVE